MVLLSTNLAQGAGPKHFLLNLQVLMGLSELSCKHRGQLELGLFS